MRRFLGLFALGALMVTSAAPVAARSPGLESRGIDFTPTTVYHGNKSPSGRIAQSDSGLLNRRDSAKVHVMIKLDVDAAATYEGGLKGLPATSPAVTGKSLKQNGAALAAYNRYVRGIAAGVTRAVNSRIPGATVHRTYTVAFGGVSATLPANQARNLLNIDGVAAVMYDTVEQPLTDASPDFIGAEALYPSLGGKQKAGKGVKVGVLDTGIWPENPAFTDPGIPHPGGTYACEFGLSGDPSDPAFACNDKLIGAYAFLDTNLLVNGPALADEFCPNAADCSARDADGHGTHTSSTAAGRRLASAVLFGVDRGPISGIAPGASLIHYRVCDEDGCFSSDSVAAVEQAIMDDVDVINFSISGGADPYSDSVELAFLDAYAAGILVNASGGNDGPGAATVNHGGGWVNTVGASTSDRHFISDLHMSANGGATLTIEGVTVTAGVNSATPVVLASAAPYSNELCGAPAAPGTFTGKVVVCKRGTFGRAEKGYNVLQGGAAGMILYNPAGTTDVETDNHWLPTIHTQFEGDAVKNFVTGHTNVQAWWSTGVASHVQGDVMASFSSRGPSSDFIKPDVTAPGVQILAGASFDHTDSDVALGPDGQNFQAIAGTSMSSPHAAGVAALIKAAHPGWTPGEIKSAMMTSSLQSVLKEDGSTPANPFDRGAGSIRANRAANPTVVFDVNATAYYASGSDEFGRIDLNLPSVNAPNMPGTIKTWRTAQNVTRFRQTFDITATGPANGKITITPSVLTIDPGQSKSFFIDINGSKLADGQYFGQIVLNPRRAGALNAVLPVAFDKHPGDVTLVNTCDDTTIAKGTETDCAFTVQNNSSLDANVSVQVKGPRYRQVLINDWEAGNKLPNGFIWNGQLSGAIAPPIISLTPPGDGFFDIEDDGVPGEGIYGDETIVNYDLSFLEGFGIPGTFSYGHQLYDTIGVTSDGYIVVGGGTVEDLNFIPHEFPNSIAPNNVLAPYWTDLNPDFGGDIHIGVYGPDGGGLFYLAVQWDEVGLWGQPAGTKRTFQVWITLSHDTADEYTTFEYHATEMGDGTPGTFGDDGGWIVGAENRDGTSGVDLGPNTNPSATGYQVITGSSTPGGSETIGYDALGRVRGRYTINVSMVTDITQGTAVDLTRIRVTR